MAIEFLSSSHF